MLAALTDEQEAFRRVVTDLAGSVAVRNPSDAGLVDRGLAWQRLASVDALGLRVREDGRPMASGTEVRLVVEALAGGLVPVPFVGTSLAVDLIGLSGGAPSLIGDVASGSTRWGLALGSDLGGLATFGDEGAVAWDVDGADFVVALHAGDGEADVVRVPIESSDVSPGALDPTRSVAPVRWDDAERVGRASIDDMTRWEAFALALLSADIVGAMRQDLEHAIAYSKERIQYGVPVGSFQALQHRMVDAYVDLQAASGLATYAAWAVDALDARTALLAGQRAKAYASRVGLPVVETAMQVFGGIGLTREHIAHLFSRRVIADRQIFGAEMKHLQAIADARVSGLADTRLADN